MDGASGISTTPALLAFESLWTQFLCPTLFSETLNLSGLVATVFLSKYAYVSSSLLPTSSALMSGIAWFRFITEPFFSLIISFEQLGSYCAPLALSCMGHKVKLFLDCLFFGRLGPLIWPYPPYVDSFIFCSTSHRPSYRDGSIIVDAGDPVRSFERGFQRGPFIVRVSFHFEDFIVHGILVDDAPPIFSFVIPRGRSLAAFLHVVPVGDVLDVQQHVSAKDHLAWRCL